MSGSGSSSFDDVYPRHPRDDYDHTITPSSTGLSASQLSTPIISHQNALTLLLHTPPSAPPAPPAPPAANSGLCDPKNVASLKSNDYFNTEDNDHAPSTSALLPPIFASQQHNTASMFSSNYYNNSLEPPAWKPPDAEEIEYTDAWNNIYNNQHHYLQPDLTHADDNSTIDSSQTNNSRTNDASNSSFNHVLRPRGLSLCSYADDPSVGSCTQSSQRGQDGQQHRRHPSLPASFFSSASSQQGGSNQQLFTAPQKGSQNQLLRTNKQYINLLQSTTKSTPYELHSHHNASQVQADGAMAGLSGILLDLYTVDRTVDSATAKMLATKEEDAIVGDNNNLRKKGGNKQSSPRKSRKTAIGTLNDIQCILGLHKVDKIVDRFKRHLQMPHFFEEEAWESNVWKDLRRTDMEMEEYARKKKSKESAKETQQQREGHGSVGRRGKIEKVHHQFDLSDDEEGVGWNNPRQGLEGEDIHVSSESHLTDHSAYKFFDPHETGALEANSYQSSQVSASINDDLREIVDLLRTDVKVDGASKYHTEMEMVRPLLEVDREMKKWKARSEARDLWDGDLRALYMTDLAVDGAARKYAPKPQEVEPGTAGDLDVEGIGNTAKKHDSIPHKTKPRIVEDIISDDLEAKTTSTDTIKQQDPMPPVHAPICTDQEVKEMLSQHIPQVSRPFCPTSPELMASKTTVQAAAFILSPVLSAPMPSTQQSTRRAIFSTREKSNANMMPKPKPTKRSIFSRQEKSSAKSQCAFQRGVMMPGTTTVVMTKGGEMIGDIPVGRVIITDVVRGASIR